MNKILRIKQATKTGYALFEVGGVADLNYATSKTRRGRVEQMGRISPTITTENNPYRIEKGNKMESIRIRKLTPRECYRLQDVDEDYIDRMLDAESNTQNYKAAGNSITVNCLVAILGQLFDDEDKQNKYKEKGVRTMAMTLKAVRINKGLTQTQAAEYLGVNRDTVCRWESGKSFPTVPQIKKIESLYGVSYNDINFLPESSV